MHANKDRGNGRNLFPHVDDIIMKGVNNGVRAWNWTTGMTKADLANIMLAGSVIAESVGVGMDNKSLAPFVFLTMGSFAVRFQFLNSKIEKMENDASESNAKSAKAENYKEKYRSTGSSHFMLGGVFESFSIPNLGWTLFSAGLGIIDATSFYVMRADNPPPRKNCLSRGWEKTIGWLRVPETAKETVRR